MPSADTFSIAPIEALLRRYLEPGMVVVDPCARNSRVGTLTNDIDPRTSATSHLEATEFLDGLIAERFLADVVVFDPPYSPRQVSETYKAIGLKVTMQHTQNASFTMKAKNRLDRILKPGGVSICCDWNSSGMGDGRLYQIEEILLVCHGSAHNDTIVTVERKLQAGFDFGAEEARAAREPRP